MIGTLSDGKMIYKPVTSCLTPLGELHGKHVVTVEGLKQSALSAVQAEITATGGSQCGFCTPGIVVSLTAMLMNKGSAINSSDVKYALSGHLCRCTGYASLLRTGNELITIAKKIGQPDSANFINNLIDVDILPEYFTEIQTKIDNLPKKASVSFASQKLDLLIAGGTDLYVQQGETIPEKSVYLVADAVNDFPEMAEISINGKDIHVGAGITFEGFAESEIIQQAFPNIQADMELIASWQIRNRATLGGNIVNASPIGDMTNFLLALNSKLVLKTGKQSRMVLMKDFFLGYKTLDKLPNELITKIIFPTPTGNTLFNYEKVSKRKYLDISSLTSGICIVMDGNKIEKVGISIGGAAAIPLFMQATCDYLIGKIVAKEVIEKALEIAKNEVSPMSDVRGSAEYKQQLTRQLILAHFITLFPDEILFVDFVAR